MYTYTEIIGGYKVFYNGETGKYEAENTKSKASFVETMFSDTVCRWYETFENANEIAKTLNDELEHGIRVVTKCVNCGAVFEILPGEVEWYREKGFPVPKRCSACRFKRKGKHHKEG